VSLPIPALVNPHAGGAEKVHGALSRDGRFVARDTAPATIADAVRAYARDGASRVLVCGGDGTVAAALGASAGTALEIAVFPSGTLNHFAHDLGLPVDDPTALLDIAATGTVLPVDLGYVNDHVILNTSSIGSYVDFVRHRDSTKRWLGYQLASLIAAVRVWLRPRSVVVDVHADDGTHRTFKTPLVFVGVDERKLDRTGLGARLAGGAHLFHVVVVNERSPSRLGALAFGALVRGVEEFVRDDRIDAHLVGDASVVLRHATGTIAVDGELIRVRSPLRYEFKPNAARVVVRDSRVRVV
jgi:diacylglycerol kinase family enzyme